MKLCIPETVLTQHLVILGKTGSGKSSALRHIYEHLLSKGKRVCVVDPKGDHWGIKWAADGHGEGYRVILFGDFKEGKASDVPINSHSGSHIAELVATGNRPCVIGFRGWTTADMTRFWIDFAATLFAKNAGELFLVGDEFHNFAPKGKIMDPQAGKCLHWSNRLLSEGRGLGLVCLLASQRPQKVHNDTLTSCETLIAMRVIHAADRNAVQDWIDGCGDRAVGKAVLDSLAALPRGEAFVWSPEVAFGPQRVKFPMFETFDSFAPPQLQKKVSAADWSHVDLEAVKQKLSRVIEEHKANDPAELKRKVAELQRELTIAQRNHQEVKQSDPIVVSVLTDEDRQMLKEWIDEMSGLTTTLRAESTQLGTFVGSITDRLRQVNNPTQRHVPVKTPSLNQNVRKVENVNRSNGALDGPKQRILDTVGMLLQRGLHPNRDMIARWLGIHPNGGSYGQNLAALRSEGYLDDYLLMEKAAAIVKVSESGINGAMRVLDGPEQNIVEILHNSSGKTHTRDTLAEELGIHPNGGSYGQHLARLRTMGLIPKKGPIQLTPEAYA